MDTFDKMHIAQTIRHLAEAYDKMGEALKGAQAAKQKKLFDIIYAKQWEIACLAADLIADMQPKPPEQVEQTECDDCGHKNSTQFPITSFLKIGTITLAVPSDSKGVNNASLEAYSLVA